MTIHNPSTDLKTVVQDLATEGDDLYALLTNMDTGYWTESTKFKDWSIWDVVAHLHVSDHMALTSIESATKFKTLMSSVRSQGLRGYADAWLSTAQGQPVNGPELLDRWRTLFQKLCENLSTADPNTRFEWAGPGMKAKMFATARQMETWAHGSEIYDVMNVQRKESDRLIHIATIGVRTFGWTFTNRNLPVPDQIPYVELTAPSTTRWTWNEENTTERISGSAFEFCQVVTQVRNIVDTNLAVTGDVARAWMDIAQCFAGSPENPPAPGSR